MYLTTSLAHYSWIYFVPLATAVSSSQTRTCISSQCPSPHCVGKHHLLWQPGECSSCCDTSLVFCGPERLCSTTGLVFVWEGVCCIRNWSLKQRKIRPKGKREPGWEWEDFLLLQGPVALPCCVNHRLHPHLRETEKLFHIQQTLPTSRWCVLGNTALT